MLRREDGRWVLYCDRCSNYEEFEEGETFRDVLKKAGMEGGWRMRYREYEGWENICPVCAKEGK